MIEFQMVIHTYGNPIGDTIREYIEKRYDRWLDFSKYHCPKAGIEDEAVDVLNEVILNVLEKYDPETLVKMIRLKKIQKGNEYTQFDFFILGILRQNIYSKTAPYRAKNRPIPSSDVDLQKIRIIDENDDEPDKPGQILKEMRLVRWVANGLELNSFERAVFEHHFVNGEPLSLFPEKYKNAYTAYAQIVGTIRQILYFYGQTKVRPKRQLTDRQNELATRFIKTHKVHIQRYKYQLINT